MYPIFQFNVENVRVLPVMASIFRTRPESMSDLMLLHWFTQPHFEFDGTPESALSSDPDRVLDIFRRDSDLPVHG